MTIDQLGDVVSAFADRQLRRESDTWDGRAAAFDQRLRLAQLPLKAGHPLIDWLALSRATTQRCQFPEQPVSISDQASIDGQLGTRRALSRGRVSPDRS
jgi:hypothetical protein